MVTKNNIIFSSVTIPIAEQGLASAGTFLFILIGAKVLGIEESATDKEIKRAYRKLMSQNHPDKLASKGLPQEMMDLAKEKTQDIQKAYELLRNHRSFK